MKINQIGRSILTNSFFSRMVQMRRCFLTTCTKQLHEEKNIKQMCYYGQEKGRSMVEIIGVLAIIGVLTVGSIIGYTNATEKHKWNIFKNGLNHLIMNATEISANQKNTDRIDIIPILYKTNHMPTPFNYKNSVVNQYQLFYKGYFSYAYLYSIDSAIVFETHGIQPKICEKILMEDWDNLDWDNGIFLVGTPSKTFKTKPSLSEINQYCKKVTRLDLRFKMP